MITLKHGEANNREFTGALRNLMAQPLEGRLAYRLMKIIEKLEKELQLNGKLLAALPEKYGKKDEQGKTIFDEQGNLVTLDEKKAEFVKELSDIMNIEFKIDVLPIEEAELMRMNANISVKDLLMLKPLMEKEKPQEEAASV